MRAPFDSLFGITAISAAVFAFSPLSAQERADRPFVDSLFVALAQAKEPATLPPSMRCDHREASLTRLCQGLIATRRAEFTVAPSDAMEALSLFERVLADRPQWPVAWYGLGVARLQASRARVVAHEGPLQPTGVSNDAAAGYALTHALELDSNFVQAAEALALAPTPREGASRLAERATMLDRVRRLLPPPALYAAALVERDAGNRDTAIAILRAVLAEGGVPHGLIELALARELYATKHPVEGRTTLLAGAGDSATYARKAYRQELQWVASPAELAQWDSLPATERSAWLADFWAARDVQDGRVPGDRLIEHYRRMEVAFVAYRITLPASGRQQAPGVAQTVDYYNDEVLRDYFEQHPSMPGAPGISADAASAYDRVVGQINRVSEDGNLLGDRSPFETFRTTQTLIDDRGVVFIRQGEPDAHAKTVGGEAMELWVYNRQEGPLVLSFREVEFEGEVGAAQLVPTLLSANPLLRDQLCHLQPSICSINADPRGTMLTVGIPSMHDCRLPGSHCGDIIDTLKGASAITSSNLQTTYEEAQRLSSGVAMRHAHDEGMAAIATVTTTDAFPQRFAHPLTPAVQIYGLDRATGGAPRLVMAFAIPANQLSSATSAAAGGRTVYPIHFHIVAARRADGLQFTLDTLRAFATSAPLAADAYFNGFVEMPVPAGVYAASITITQDGDHGAVAQLDEIAVPGASTALSVSDLVFGREDSRVRWNSGATAVPLNPLNTYGKGGAASVYFQLANMVPGTSYRTRFQFFRAGDDAKRPPRLALAFEQAATQPRAEIVRSLGLGNLDPGVYRVQLTVDGAAYHATSVAWLTIRK